jgi:hypothetical protein
MFVGGKGAPGKLNGKQLTKGDIIELPETYKRFKWYKSVTAEDANKVVEAPKQVTKIKVPPEAEAAFAESIGRSLGAPIEQLEASPQVSEELVPLENVPKSTADLEKMNKSDLVSLIKGLGMEAEMSTLKAVLVQTAAKKLGLQ